MYVSDKKVHCYLHVFYKKNKRHFIMGAYSNTHQLIKILHESEGVNWAKL